MNHRKDVHRATDRPVMVQDARVADLLRKRYSPFVCQTVLGHPERHASRPHAAAQHRVAPRAS